jgi:hypothetical protein
MNSSYDIFACILNIMFELLHPIGLSYFAAKKNCCSAAVAIGQGYLI